MNLRQSGNDVDTVFALNGVDENSATFALGWVLSKSPALLHATIHNLAQIDIEPGQALIDVQKHGKDKGYTDIEILTPNSCNIIIEAKQHWVLPSEEQLKKYATRLKAGRVIRPLIVSLSAASRDYAKRRLPCSISNISLVHRSWADLDALVYKAYSNTKSREEKHWLREFKIHLRRYVSMRNQQDNWVFVVSLSSRYIKKDSSYTSIDVVDKDNQYFHPVGNRWPVMPPNYIAFRYGGQLQSVHHIESYEVVTDLSSANMNWPKTDSDYFLYNLGPAMKPPVTIRNGSIWNSGRYWCAIDTLLSGAYKTISGARDESYRRLEANKLD